MFSGRKIGAAGRFGKTTFLVICVAALMIAARASVAPAKPTAPGTGKAISKTASASPSDMLPKGRRAYSIIPDNSNNVLAAASAGRRVDVTAAFPAGPDGMPMAVTVLRSAPVIGSKPASTGTSLVLSVTPEDAERMAFAVANARIFVSICPEGPDTALPTSEVTFNDF